MVTVTMSRIPAGVTPTLVICASFRRITVTVRRHSVQKISLDRHVCLLDIFARNESGWVSYFICFGTVCSGVSIPRQGNDGAFLPSARDISLAVHKDVDAPHDHLTSMAAIWGEMIHNDISHTPQMAGMLLYISSRFFFKNFINQVSSRKKVFWVNALGAVE